MSGRFPCKCKSKIIIIPIILVLALVCLGGCGGSSDSRSNVTGDGGFVTEPFMIPFGDGSFLQGEIVAPAGSEKDAADSESSDFGDGVPLVCMSHGIYGTMNSGGASQLSEMLASNGIAAVRVDFNRYRSDDPDVSIGYDKEGRLNEYTLSDMMKSNGLAIDFAMENYRIDKDRIGLYGRSLGGRIAMLMGNESYGGIDYKSMALIAPAGNEYSLIHYMGGDGKWNEMRDKAIKDGVFVRSGLRLTPEWFEDYDRLNPVLTADKFGDKPVMVYYNTKDTVVEPKTSLECANAYSNVKIYEVTTDNGHGYEMSCSQSEIKDEIMNRVVEFFGDTL